MKKYLKYVYFPVIFIYWEIVFKIFSGKNVTGDVIYPIFSAITLGGIVALLTSLLPKLWNRIIGYAFIVIGCVLFCVHIVYYDIFKTAFTFSLIFGGAEAANAVTQFAGNTVTAIIDNIVPLILCILPIVVAIILDVKLGLFERMGKIINLVSVAAVIVVYVVSIIVVSVSGDKGYTAKVLYFDDYVKDIAFERLGVLTSTRIDIKQMIFGVEEKITEITGVQEIPTLPGMTDSAGKQDETSGNSGEEETSGEEIVEPIVYEPNVLNIDFDAFTAGESGSYIEWLNEFYAASTPTMQNEYTGLFEDYNLILITAESFSPWAVSEKYTPTLYKLVNEGFVFENFYTNAYNNTTMGEWTVCTGLLPNGMGEVSFAKTVSDGYTYMGMCMGNILKERGYSTWAYHNHTYSYYNRDETHPIMGYTYKGLGNGLDVKEVWPESDLEMMQASVDDYINDEHFHAYYMTVSGHLNYSWVGNSMSYKNRDLVADMDASEAMKAYMACNIELDKALEYLIQRLEEKGIADKTVIAMACDHYPYALEEEISEIIGEESKEFYGLYENNLVIWSGSMEEPVHVEKVCASVDIIPTILNLMGIEYDSRLYSGKDILSDTPGMVIFSDMGFATDYCIYNATTGNVKATTDVEITDEYVEAVRAYAKNVWDAAGRIIDTDYYAKLKKYLK